MEEILSIYILAYFIRKAARKVNGSTVLTRPENKPLMPPLSTVWKE